MKRRRTFGFGLWLTLAAAALAVSMPDFTLKRIDGSTFQSTAVIGRDVVLIDFWATWCRPCGKLLKQLQLLQERFAGQGVRVIAVSTDDASAFSQVRNYIAGRNFTFSVLLDPDGVLWRIFNPSQQLPFTMLIDRRGDIAYTHSGYVPGMEKELEREIEKLLAGS